jgi:hypothetical protein
MADNFRPTEFSNDKPEKPTFKFFLVEVTVHTPGNIGWEFERNVPMRNPFHAIDFALRDIKKCNTGVIFDNITVNVSPFYTKEPQKVPFNPDNPED